MSTNISNVVSVLLLKEPQLADRANVNVVGLFTSEQTKLNSFNTWETQSSKNSKLGLWIKESERKIET